ncbi:unnamed protein product [Orchesella dallaii]|uniref:Uncharacterized protein n=1 Tax=Orchesella dallaii TaxID=48710 RepID=A0ABP1PTK7_9HEXA
MSPVFVPESLLADRLRDLEDKMPLNKEFVYPSSDVARYYRLKTSVCIYDSRGGLIKIGVPLMEKSTAYQVFQYRPLEFAIIEFKCSLDAQATLVIKDANSNEVFPITELELETCQPSSGLCLVPLSSDMDSASVCIVVLLKGSLVDTIKENCPLKCTRRAQPELSKISEDIFVGTHLRKTGIQIRCPDDGIMDYHSVVTYGSTKFSLACTECDILWNGRVVGEASSSPCKDIVNP